MRLCSGCIYRMEKYDMRGVEFLFVAKPAHYKYRTRAGAGAVP